jgi:hypothetical protein
MPGQASGSVNSQLLLIFNTTTWANVAINATSGPFTNWYLSLHTADPIAGNQSTSELSYSGSTPYARVAVARSSGGFTVSSNTVVTAGNTTFPQNTSITSQTALFWGVGSASSGNGIIEYSGPICASAVTPIPFTCTNASPAVFTSHAHGFSAGQAVLMWAGVGGTLPTGFSASTIYYVISSGLTTDAFQLSATLGGSAINSSSSGDGVIVAASPLIIGQNVTPILSAGTVITGV